MTSPDPKDHWRFQLSQAFMVLGLGLLIFAGWMSWRKFEPFHTWFFSFAWWSYILMIDGWVYRRRGESLLLTFPGRFFFLAAWSVVLWFIFEAFNLRLNNWYYNGLPPQATLRWLGYVLAFATVVPAVFETADLIDTAGFIKSGKVRPLGWKTPVGRYFAVAGAVMVALPLILPSFFFPLVWGAFIFLLEPFNERLGASSLLSDWREGNLKRLFTLLVAGFFCGGLWEAWNALAGAHWTYSVPWVGDTKIFRMPVLGYLGFPPFAVEVFVMTSFVLALWDRVSGFLRGALVVAGAAAVVALSWAVDKFTVAGFHS